MSEEKPNYARYRLFGIKPLAPIPIIELPIPRSDENFSRHDPTQEELIAIIRSYRSPRIPCLSHEDRGESDIPRPQSPGLP